MSHSALQRAALHTCMHVCVCKRASNPCSSVSCDKAISGVQNEVTDEDS